MLEKIQLTYKKYFANEIDEIRSFLAYHKVTMIIGLIFLGFSIISVAVTMFS